jgi:RHS repeat-associated protein
MRLLKARRGDFTGADPAPSAFVAAPGTQKYQYDFVGNIRSTDILANASEQQSAADRKLAASFNAANEQTNYVETVGGGGSLGSTFTITHDAAGNVRTRETVAGGNRLAYRHDRWGRLTEVDFQVKTTSGYDPKPRARYRYNALGMRALVERDADTTDNAQSINERRYLYYNAAWQIVEEHVDAGFASASDPVSIDRIVQNIWGLRYIDDLVLRRVDANYPGSGLPDFSQTAAGDIDWEQYLTDHQFSVVAAVGRTGTLAFRVAYDAYGEARHLPAKDINGDGKVDSADTAIAQAAVKKRIGEPGYNPDADWDRDGTVTSTDIAQFGSRSYIAALPQGQLAQPGGATQPLAGDVSPSADLARAANARSDFNIGFSGYRFNGDIGAYTVRFRHYDPTPGMCRWLERDPAGYQDGPSLYSYLGRNPMAGTDPYGLASSDGFYSPEPVDIPESQRRTPGKPIAPPGKGLRLHSVDGNSAAGNHIRCEESRIATHIRPWAGRLSNDWTREGWFHSVVVEGNNPFHEWLAQNFWLRFHSEEWINSPGAVWETVAIAVGAAVLIVKAPAIGAAILNDAGCITLPNFAYRYMVLRLGVAASGIQKFSWMVVRVWPLLTWPLVPAATAWQGLVQRFPILQRLPIQPWIEREIGRGWYDTMPTGPTPALRPLWDFYRSIRGLWGSADTGRRLDERDLPVRSVPPVNRVATLHLSPVPGEFACRACNAFTYAA